MAKPIDPWTKLAKARRSVKNATARAERAWEAVRNVEPDRKMPLPGSLWKQHPALLAEYDTAYAWTYRHLAWNNTGQQMAVLETQIDGKPYFRVVHMDTFLVEFVGPSDHPDKVNLKPKRKR